MANSSLPEVWLRGPLEEVPALLQPAAHALLQAQEEIQAMLHDFPDQLLWEKPAGVASVAFHLQHIAGVLDRLLAYAAGQQLSDSQLAYLQQEGVQAPEITLASLLTVLNAQFQIAIHQIKHTDPDRLTDTRGVGRKQVPSTVQGLLFHAAEHTMRHTGQLHVTVKILQATR